VCVCVCTYTYTCTHTHTHIHAYWKKLIVAGRCVYKQPNSQRMISAENVQGWCTVRIILSDCSSVWTIQYKAAKQPCCWQKKDARHLALFWKL